MARTLALSLVIRGALGRVAATAAQLQACHARAPTCEAKQPWGVNENVDLPQLRVHLIHHVRVQAQFLAGFLDVHNDFLSHPILQNELHGKVNPFGQSGRLHPPKGSGVPPPG